MWSVRPFSPRCAALLGERAAEAMAARLDAAADRCLTALRVVPKRFCGRLDAADDRCPTALPFVPKRLPGRLDAAADRYPTALRVVPKRFRGRLDAVLAPIDGVTDRPTRPS